MRNAHRLCQMKLMRRLHIDGKTYYTQSNICLKMLKVYRIKKIV